MIGWPRRRPTQPETPPAPGEPPTTHVEVSAGGHQVIVEAPLPLDQVVATVLTLWRATDGPTANLPGTVLGFTAADTTITDNQLMPADTGLPQRLNGHTPDRGAA